MRLPIDEIPQPDRLLLEPYLQSYGRRPVQEREGTGDIGTCSLDVTPLGIYLDYSGGSAYYVGRCGHESAHVNRVATRDVYGRPGLELNRGSFDVCGHNIRDIRKVANGGTIAE